MNARLLVSTVFVVFAAAAAVRAQSTMDRISLADGEDGTNRVASPVYETARVAPLAVGAFTAAYDKKQLFVRRGGGNMFTRGPEYKLSPAFDVVALLSESVAAQAKAMGFRAPAAGESGWKLSGAVRDIFLESRQIPYGATLFYGYLDVEVQVESPTGAKQALPMRIHSYSGSYNAGLARKDEAQASAARLLVEGAQELLARVNRLQIKAPPAAAIAAQVASLAPGRTTGNRAALRAIGLSGATAATPALLAALPAESTESGRSAVIDALASLGSPSAIGPLSSRYATEDEDCRWFTLKAMDYIGGDEAMKLVSTAGVKDKDVGPKRLAERIAGRK